MKKFLLNTIVISTLLFFALNWVPSWLINPLYGNKPYATKHAYFIKNQQKYNSLIFGSSRLYRQLDPIRLDEHLAACNTSTFSLAAPATYNPESYYLYEKLLQEENPDHLSFVFIELQPLVDIEEKNIKTDQSYYWMNVNDLSYAVSYSISSNYSIEKKTGIIKDYLLSYIYRVLFNSKVLLSSNNDIGNQEIIGKEGYYSLDAHVKSVGNSSGLKKRLDTFFADPTELFNRISYTNDQFAIIDHSEHLNQTHLKKIESLIDQSNDLGIHLVFIIPPRLHQHYEELLALKSQLPPEHIIEIANPQKYPEMYDLEFSFDAGHLNEAGAAIFTDYVSDQLLKICSQ